MCVCECVSARACLQFRWVWGWAGILEDRVFLLGRGQIFRTGPQDPWYLRACVRACVFVCVCARVPAVTGEGCKGKKGPMQAHLF